MAMIGPLRKRFPQAELDFVLLGDESIPLRCLQSEILINATSMGMNNSPSPHVDMVPWTRLPRSTVCAEIIHKPLETAFVRISSDEWMRCAAVRNEGGLASKIGE